MVNGTPLDVNAIRNELLQNKNQYNYNNDVDLTTLSKEQLIDELQKCKDTCKLLQNQYNYQHRQISQKIPEHVVEQQQMITGNNMISTTFPVQPVIQDVQTQDGNFGMQLSNEQQMQSNNEISNPIEQKQMLEAQQIISNESKTNLPIIQEVSNPNVALSQQIIPNTVEKSADTIGVQDNTSINSEQMNILNNGSINSSDIEGQNNNSEILPNSNLLDNDSLSGVSNESSIDSNNIDSQTNNTELDGDADEEFKQIQGIANALNANSN